MLFQLHQYTKKAPQQWRQSKIFLLICYSAHLFIDVHCSAHLKKIYNFLIKPLIKIIQMSLCSIFSFHSFIPYLPCSLKSSEASFIFFHHLLLSHQALISPIFLISPHLSSSHLPAKPKPKPKPSPSPAPVPAVAVAVAAPCSLKL